MSTRNQRFPSAASRALGCQHAPDPVDAAGRYTYPPKCIKCGFRIIMRNGEWILPGQPADCVSKVSLDSKEPAK